MKKCLIFDADDTLWENNIFFERAIEEFLALITAVAPDRQRALELLEEVEREFILQSGYGTRNFINALIETFRRLHGREDGAVYISAIEKIGERLIDHPLDLLPEVASTLESLRVRYRLLLFTKGDVDEQSAKVDRSGLKAHFDGVEIVAEKNTDAYHELITRHRLDREITYMIGNSPRSDVLPALQAGLWAVFVPHPHTWKLEEDVLEPHPRLLTVESLRQLPSVLANLHGLDN